MSIGKKLLSLRKQKGISQQDLALYLNVTRQTISKFEHDLSLPDIDMMMKICKYYQISLNELLGIENDISDMTEVYRQIQLVANNIQKNNKKSKLLNIILIIVCAISLGLSLFMVNRINYYEKIYQSYLNSFQQQNHRTLVNIIDNDNKLFIEENNATFMDIKEYDLEKERITLNYQFNLKSFTKDTTIDIEFILSEMEDEKYHYTLEKKDNNTFVFNKEIPLKDYDTVYLYINDGNGNIISENIGKNQNCYYLRDIIEEICYIYFPVDKNNQLIRNQIVFDPTHIKKLYNIKGNLKIGSLIIQMYKENGTCLLDIGMPINEKKIMTLKENISLNENIYLSIRVSMNTKEVAKTYYLFDMRGNNNKLTSSFKIDRDDREYFLYPR